MSKKTNEVSKILNDNADLFNGRDEQYGNSYKNTGYILVGMFPEGVNLTTAEDFNRFAILSVMAGKMGRYAHNFAIGGRHKDSLDDISVYAAMLQNMDDKIL